ncbi:UDP-N-acetylglucosamine 2-epimerase [Paenibacillus campi]|uniref:UDP-N-acetylglucosamine 2-epimerase n=1 Tax=Paenibacillus campi TaxID=3106031 RepID=UPI002AFDFACC|nr:UDP-N-acetylglucosamine 2-epimerase [Paenibacillus sp. SGZ-1014]
MDKKKICVVTGTRAEYGIMKNVLNHINQDCSLELQLIATGTHLSQEYGLTYQEIEQDGFKIDEKVEMLLSVDTTSAIAKSLGLAVIGFSNAYSNLQPDCVLVTGDRYEALAAVQTAVIMGIPIAHISGGEITEGAIDDSIRHAITKLSNIHFPANETYRKRIIQMGEYPELVFNVGDPSVESIYQMDFLEKKELEQFFEISLDRIIVVTYHPVTTEPQAAEQQIKELFSALDECQGYNIIITKANSDHEGRIINQLIDEYSMQNKDRVRSYFSLGYKRYLSTMRLAKAVVGNSSSGIIEAPILNVPTIDIGNRQKGRMKAASVIEVDCHKNDIINAIRYIESAAFKMQIANMELMYDGKNTAHKIIEILKAIDMKQLNPKAFYDLVKLGAKYRT